MELPEKIRKTVLGACLAYMNQRNPNHGPRLQEICKELDEEFDTGMASPTLVHFYWEVACRYLDTDEAERAHYQLNLFSKVAATHASFLLRTDAHRMWRQAAKRESQPLQRVSATLNYLADYALLIAGGASSVDPGPLQAIKNIGQIFPEHDYEILRILPSWNRYAVGVRVEVTSQREAYGQNV